MRVWKRRHFNIFAALLCVILIAYSLLLLVMFGWALMTSLKETIDFSIDPYGWPVAFEFSNYSEAFKMIRVQVPYGGTYRWAYLWEMLFNSVIYSLGCALVSTFVPCVMAYLTAKYRFRLNKFIHTLVIVAMILPIVGSLPSEMQIIKSIGLYDTMFGVFLLKSHFLSMYFLIFYGTFKSLSWEYAEAAFVDGASHLTIMLRIMFPLIKTAIFAVMLLQFIGYWNDYQTPMLYIPSRPTASYGLFQFSNLGEEGAGSVPIKLAGSMIVMAPILALFIIFRNKFIGNLTLGGIKG